MRSCMVSSAAWRRFSLATPVSRSTRPRDLARSATAKTPRGSLSAHLDEVHLQQLFVGADLVQQEGGAHRLVGDGVAQAFDLVYGFFQSDERLFIVALQPPQTAQPLVEPLAQLRQRETFGEQARRHEVRFGPVHVGQQQVHQAQVRVDALHRPVLFGDEFQRPPRVCQGGIEGRPLLLHERLVQHHPAE